MNIKSVLGQLSLKILMNKFLDMRRIECNAMHFRVAVLDFECQNSQSTSNMYHALAFLQGCEVGYSSIKVFFLWKVSLNVRKFSLLLYWCKLCPRLQKFIRFWEVLLLKSSVNSGKILWFPSREWRDSTCSSDSP